MLRVHCAVPEVRSSARPHLHRVSAAMAKGKRPVPSRTRKLSLSAPMVLRGGLRGRVGRRRTSFLDGDHFGGPHRRFCSLHPERDGPGEQQRSVRAPALKPRRRNPAQPREPAGRRHPPRPPRRLGSRAPDGPAGGRTVRCHRLPIRARRPRLPRTSTPGRPRVQRRPARQLVETWAPARRQRRRPWQLVETGGRSCWRPRQLVHWRFVRTSRQDRPRVGRRRAGQLPYRRLGRPFGHAGS